MKKGALKRVRRDYEHQQPAVAGMLAERVVIEGVTYERAYVRCGRECSVCQPGRVNYDPERPGHGPYWYKVVKYGNVYRRSYIGARLFKAGSVGSNESATSS